MTFFFQILQCRRRLYNVLKLQQGTLTWNCSFKYFILSHLPSITFVIGASPTVFPKNMINKVIKHNISKTSDIVVNYTLQEKYERKASRCFSKSPPPFHFFMCHRNYVINETACTIFNIWPDIHSLTITLVTTHYTILRWRKFYRAQQYS